MISIDHPTSTAGFRVRTFLRMGRSALGTIARD
jgi:hypothetical protein